MSPQVASLRSEWERAPSNLLGLRLLDACLSSDLLSDWAVGAGVSAQLLGAGCTQPGLVRKHAELARRVDTLIRQRASEGVQPLDPDRMPYPRGTAPENWDELGTRKETEKHLPRTREQVHGWSAE